VTVVVPIVEGHGEVAAVPELLRRMVAWSAPSCYVEVAPPIRTARSKFLNDPDEFSKMLQLASLKAADTGWVLLLLDADDDCPVTLARDVERRASTVIDATNLSIVIANREFEAWFIASATSLDGCRGFKFDPVNAVGDPDRPRGAKGWLARQMNAGYHEVTDQPAFAASMNLAEAWANSRSFRRLCAEFSRRVHNLPE
jgi:hypothetical protein